VIRRFTAARRREQLQTPAKPEVWEVKDWMIAGLISAVLAAVVFLVIQCL